MGTFVSFVMQENYFYPSNHMLIFFISGSTVSLIVVCVFFYVSLQVGYQSHKAREASPPEKRNYINETKARPEKQEQVPGRVYGC